METKTFKGILLLAVLCFPAAVLSQSRGEFLRAPEGNSGYGRSSAQPEYYDSRQPPYYQHQSQSQIHPSPAAYNANAYGQPAYAPPPPAWQSQDQTSYYQQPSPQNYNQQPYPQNPNQQSYPQNFNQQPQSQNNPQTHPPRPFNPILAGIPRPQLPILRPQGNRKPSKPILSVDNRFGSTSNGQQTGNNQPSSQSGDFDTTRATQSPTKKKKPTTTMSPPPTFDLDNRFDVRDKVSKTLSFNPEISAAMEVFALRSMLTFNAFINEDNFMFSPFSIFHLLSLIAEGARGSTLRELNTELGLKDTLKTRDFQQYLNVALNRTTADVVLRKFSMLVTDINRPVSREYESTIEKVYDADVFPVDFRDVRTTEKIINGNVSEQTQGLITDTVTKEDLFKAQMILISGLFFQGNWANVFNKTFTKREAFHDTNMNKVGEVNMMFQRGPFAYSAVKDLGCHILELPYAESPASRNDGFGTGLSMILVLPRKGLELSEAIENVHRHGLERIYRELNTARTEYEDDEVEVHVPRFEVSTSLNLKETLEAMGIKEIFEQNADLSGINTNYYVSAMVHKTKISVDEKGTTAAAVTTSIFANKATPPKFHANKPFLFFIVDRVTKMILFSGQYVAPEVY